ncbi:unnamed protein product [Caenorhabditis nigoni]
MILVARASLGDMKGRVILDAWAIPQYEIASSDTTFSGITEKDQSLDPPECHRYVSPVDVLRLKKRIQNASTSKSSCDLPAERDRGFLRTCCLAHPTYSIGSIANVVAPSKMTPWNTTTSCYKPHRKPAKSKHLEIRDYSLPSHVIQIFITGIFTN